MTRSVLFKWLSWFIVVAMLVGFVPSFAPSAQATLPAEALIPSDSRPPFPTLSTWAEPTQALSIEGVRKEIQIPLSRRSQNALSPIWEGNRNVLLTSDWVDSSLLTTGKMGIPSLSNTSRNGWQSPYADSIVSPPNLQGLGRVPLFNLSPSPNSSSIGKTLPSPATVNNLATPNDSLHQVFLPLVSKNIQPTGWTVITPAGGSLFSPDGQNVITFAPDGLPEPLMAFYAGNRNVDLPLHLYPFGSAFAIQARWLSNGMPVTELDPEAIGAWPPVEPRYWATVSIRLTGEELALADPAWLAIARLDQLTGSWVLLPVQIDEDTGTVTAHTSRLGTFILVQNMPNAPAVGPGDVVVDDQDAGFVRYEENKGANPPLYPSSFWWDGGCGGNGCYNGHSYRTWDCTPEFWQTPYCPWDWGTWTPALPQTGYYLVSAFIPGTEATTMSADYEIHHNGTVDTVPIAQGAQPGQFVPLGAYEFSADGSEFLYLDDDVMEDGLQEVHVGYDAAIFTFAGEAPPSPEEIARQFALGVQRWQKYVGDPVSSSTGNHVQQIEVVRIPGHDEFEMALVLTYNALSDHNGSFGLGWSSLLDMRLRQYYDDSVMVWLPDGQGRYWRFDGSGYVGWDGVQGDLEKIAGGWKLTMPNQAVYTFQEVGWEGRLVRIEDRHSNGANLLYNGSGQVTALIDDSGRQIVFSYNGDHISQLEDPLSRTWGFRYDSDRLAEFRNARGGTTTYTYTSDGHLETMTDPEGITYLRNVYDDQGRVTEQIDANDSHSYWNYDDDNRTMTFTDNLGRQTIYRYDDLFRPVEEEDAMHQTASYEYDNDYNLTARVDKMRRRWEYTYDDRGNLLTESGPLDWYVEYTYNGTNDLTSVSDPVRGTTVYVWEDGSLVRVERPDTTTLAYTYDSYGQMRTAIDPNQHTTHFRYDEYGNLAEVHSPLGCVTGYEYDLVGRMESMTDGNGHTMYTKYDASDNVTGITDPRGHDTTFEYDGNDSLVQVVDRRGGVWIYVYDQNLKLISETDPEGHETTHTYDEMYNRVSTTNPRGNTTWFRYDKLYRLEEVEDALHNATHYEYDANDNLTKAIDALGQETEFVYDELNRLAMTIDAMENATEFHYDRVSRLVRTVNPRDAETHYEYDQVDQLRLIVDALQGETEHAYDDAGNLVATTDANDHTTLFRYDADNRLIEREDPEGHVTGYGYDCVGNLISLVDARTYPTAFQYDENDNLILVTDALQGETEYVYDEEDALLSVIDPNDHTTTFVYDLDGLQEQLIEAGGQVTYFRYDAAHNLEEVTNARGNVSRFEYDELNRLIRAYDPLNNPTVYGYDELSRLTSVTDANSTVTRYEYDPLDRLTAVVQNYRSDLPADHQTNVRTEYSYDPVGNLWTIADANGHVTEFAYDLLNRMIREVNPIDSTWHYEYDPAGNLVRRIDANEAVTDYIYDADDLPVSIHYADDSQVTFAYDATHNQVTMVDGLGTTTNTYDPLNRLTSSTNHLGQTVGYTYDPASNRIAVTYPDGRVVHTEYDPTDYPSRVIDPDGNVFAADYDPTHNVTAIHYPNLTHALMTYDDADRLVSVLNEQLDGDVISSFAYTLDPVGNRTHSDEYYRWRQPREMSHDYAYDPLYRLVGSQDSEGRLAEYIYDAVGNRLQMTSNYDPLRTPTDVNPYTVDYVYNTANQLLSTDHSVFGPTDYRYDANGNRVRRQGPDVWIGNPNDQLRTDYTYDYENRLTWVGNFFDPGNGKWQVRDETLMLFDGYGRLFRRTHDQHQGGGGQKWTEFVYDGLDPIVEYVDPSPQYDNYYRGLGRILEMHEYKSQESPPGTAYYYHYDGLGSVSALTKHRGQSAHTYRYWDYGMALDKNDRAADSSNFTDPHNHYTYTGQEWEEYTWLYHFYAREYDPVVGVWLQQDPYRGRLEEPATMHWYGFVGDNPISYLDVYGFTRTQDQLGLDAKQLLEMILTNLTTNKVSGRSAQLGISANSLRESTLLKRLPSLGKAGLATIEMIFALLETVTLGFGTGVLIGFGQAELATFACIAGLGQLDATFASAGDIALNIVNAIRGEGPTETKYGPISQLAYSLLGEQAVEVLDSAKRASDIANLAQLPKQVQNLARGLTSIKTYTRLLSSSAIRAQAPDLPVRALKKAVRVASDAVETVNDAYQGIKSIFGK